METAALACVLIVLYTYVGYPLLVAILSRLRPWNPHRDPSYEPTVSVCIAVHDGARYLERKLESLLRLDYPAEKLEFLVYLDGQNHELKDIVDRFHARDPRIRLLAGERRLGKPTAINRLRAAATGDVLLMTDVRPPVVPGALKALVSHLADAAVGAVSGNLVLAGAAGSGAYWRYEKLIRASEAKFGSLVGVTGALYAIRKEDLTELPADVVLDDMWVPLKLALKKKRRISFSDEAQAHDEAFEDEREFERKVRTLAGNYQLFFRMPELLVPGQSPVWFQAISHKILRLVCPFALVLLFLCSAWRAYGEMPSASFWRVFAGAQVAFYLLAAFGQYARNAGRIARTFVVLNAAAVVGFWRFLRRSQKITW